MKNRNRIYRTTALLMILMLLLSGVSGGADENGSGDPAAVYSGWLRLDELLGNKQDQTAPSGTRDLGLLLRRAVLLDGEGEFPAEESIWPVKPDAAYRVRLRFRETPGNDNLQFDTVNGPLVYRLPEGLSVGNQNLTLPVRIVLDPGETAEAVCVCDAAAGTLTVSLDEGSGIPEKIRRAPGAGFDVVIPAVFGDIDTLAFSDDLTVSLRRAETAPAAHLTAEGADYSVSVSCPDDEGIPANSRVTAAELTESDARYQTFLAEASRALGCGPEELTHSRLFDITIAAPDGTAVKPAGTVRVRVDYAVPLQFKEDQRFVVVHLSESGTELLAPAVGRNAEGWVDSFTFETDSFSPFGIVSAPLRGDRSETVYSSDLADFLDSVVIAGAELNEEGKYIIVDGEPYTVQMNFSEKINKWQLTTGPFTYVFPDGFAPNPVPEPGTIELTGGEGVVRLHYTIIGNTLTVTVDDTSPGYQAFLDSEKVEFEIHLTGVISKETIEFSDEVEGNYDIDKEREVTVKKTGNYNAELNRIKYTIQAYSNGNNTDVHIGDIIRGTALAYDPSSLTVSSDKQNPVQYNSDTREGETFGLTIPAMSHGETVTIEYWADVDLSRLEGRGPWTAEQTGNSVKIISNEDHPGDDDETSDENFEHHISLSTNSKTASSQIIRDGKTYITWTIVLNENANISIAGSHVTDAIHDSCRSFMRYAGDGIHIEKFEKNGSPAGTSDIAWGTNGLSASYGGSTWTYTIPDTDAGQNYRYVITYETEVDSDTLLTETAVGNTVGNEYDSDPSWTSVTVDTLEVDKTAVQSTVRPDPQDPSKKLAETEWEITFTVPPEGLDSAVITDTMPAKLNYEQEQMIWFYDAYKAGSVRVEGLFQNLGEGFTVDAESQEHQVSITFTKNNGEPGLTGTGRDRTIHVYLTTTANQDWLQFAESHIDARKHVNNAVVHVNGQHISVTDHVTYNTTAYNLEKRFDSKYTTYIGSELPVYLYRILLSNINEEVFDSDGNITIIDNYNSEYLSFYSENGTAYGYNTNGYIFGCLNEDNKESIMIGLKGPNVVASLSEGQIVFRLNKNSLPKNGNSYWPYYAIVYALQVKDAETLARMKDEALHNDGLKVDLANTAWNDQFGSDTVVTEYTVKALEKTKVENGEGPNSATGTYDIRFSIAVNPDGLKIGDGDTITLKDTLSNLSFDYTSILIEPQLEGDILNRTGNSVIFTLHNKTPYTITYTARLIGIHNVHWNNKAVLSGYTSGVSGTSSSQSGGSGSYSTYGMNVLKYAEGNMHHGLAATFELYEAKVKNADGSDIPEPEWEKVGEFTTDGTTGLYQINTVTGEGDTGPRSLRPYSFHDADENEQFGESYGWRYRIKETVAPPGYQKTTVLYEFGISDIPSYAAPYNYLNHDTVTIVNTPKIIVPPVDTEITGEKVLNGKDLENQEFAFSLSPEESVLSAWGEGYPGGFDGSLTARNDAEGHFSFPLSFTYDDYLNALDKGFADENECAYFYYVVREEIPQEAEGNFWNGVLYDQSQFLVRIRLYMDGEELKLKKGYFPYDENGIPENLLVRHSQ